MSGKSRPGSGDSARDRLIHRQAAGAADGPLVTWVPNDLWKSAGDVLGEQQAGVQGVAPELAVGGSPFLERPQRRHPVVRLPEEAKPEQPTPTTSSAVPTNATSSLV